LARAWIIHVNISIVNIKFKEDNRQTSIRMLRFPGRLVRPEVMMEIRTMEHLENGGGLIVEKHATMDTV
jgi:hypothetical protein